MPASQRKRASEGLEEAEGAEVADSQDQSPRNPPLILLSTL